MHPTATDAPPGRLPWPRDPRFHVCEDGTVYGVKGRPVGIPRADGRKQIGIWSEGRSRTFLVSHIVCETFHGPRPVGMEVAHENGDATDDRAANLAWKTHKENEADKVRHGTLRVGDRSSQAKLDEAAVLDIRNRVTRGDRLQEIADAYGVAKSTVFRAASRSTWGHLA